MFLKTKQNGIVCICCYDLLFSLSNKMSDIFPCQQTSIYSTVLWPHFILLQQYIISYVTTLLLLDIVAIFNFSVLNNRVVNVSNLCTVVNVSLGDILGWDLGEKLLSVLKQSVVWLPIKLVAPWLYFFFSFLFFLCIDLQISTHSCIKTI